MTITTSLDGRMVAGPTLWATRYRLGWTVYSMTRHILADGLTSSQARAMLIKEVELEPKSVE